MVKLNIFADFQVILNKIYDIRFGLGVRPLELCLQLISSLEQQLLEQCIFDLISEQWAFESKIFCNTSIFRAIFGMLKWPLNKLAGFQLTIQVFFAPQLTTLWRKFIVFHQRNFIFTLCAKKNTCLAYDFSSCIFFISNTYSHALFDDGFLPNKQKFRASWFHSVTCFSLSTFTHNTHRERETNILTQRATWTRLNTLPFDLSCRLYSELITSNSINL